MINERKPLPANWEWKKLMELGNISQGGTPPKDIDEYWNGTIPFITGADITSLYVSKARSFLSEKGLFSGKTQLCEKGDVLIVSRTGVGRVGIADTTLAISQDVTVLKVFDNIDPKYIALFLKFKSKKLEDAGQGATIKGLTRDYIENIKVPITPDESTQNSIANDIEKKLDEIEKVQQASLKQLEAIQSLPAAILLETFDFQEPN